MNKKGQALVEFIIILPIMLFLGFIFIDFILISYNKQKLENVIVDVGNMYKNNESNDEIHKYLNKNNENVELEFKKNEKYINIVMVKNYEFITPGIGKLFNDFKIKIERTIYDE